jgi:hypothetical protein
VNRGINANAGADFAITCSFDVGIRVSAFRSDSTHTTCTMCRLPSAYG